MRLSQATDNICVQDADLEYDGASINTVLKPLYGARQIRYTAHDL